LHTGMTHMWSHECQCVRPSFFKKLVAPCSIKLQDGRPELEPLGPFRPAAGGIFTVNGKYRCPFSKLILAFDCPNFVTRKLPKPLQLTRQITGIQVKIDPNHSIIFLRLMFIISL